MPSNKIILSALIALSFCTYSYQALANIAPANSTLFTLERSTNKNQVVYEIASVENNKNTLHPYWKMLAEDGHEEELNAFETKYAYGVKLLKETPEQLQFTLQALPAHPITVHLAEIPFATIHVLNEDRVLEKISVQVSGGLFPSAKAITLYCRSLDANTIYPIFLAKDKNGGWQENL